VFNKNQRILSLILFIVILIQGICIEGVEVQGMELVPDSAYTLFCDENNESIKAIDSDAEVITQTDSCTSDMIGIRQFAGVTKVASNHYTHKKPQKTDLYSPIVNVDECSINCDNSYKLLYTVQIQKICSDTVLLNYIHNKDGKK